MQVSKCTGDSPNSLIAIVLLLWLARYTIWWALTWLPLAQLAGALSPCFAALRTATRHRRQRHRQHPRRSHPPHPRSIVTFFCSLFAIYSDTSSLLSYLPDITYLPFVLFVRSNSVGDVRTIYRFGGSAAEGYTLARHNGYRRRREGSNPPSLFHTFNLFSLLFPLFSSLHYNLFLSLNSTPNIIMIHVAGRSIF